MELTLEQKIEKVKDLRPIDDVFFEVLASKPAVCQEILEVAAIATGWNLEPLADITGVVKVDPKLIQERMVGDFWEKHANSREDLIAQNETGVTTDVVLLQKKKDIVQ